LRSAKRSEVIRVSLIQNGQSFLDATVWTIDVGMQGLEFDDAPMPDVPGPEGLVPWQDRVPPTRRVFERFWSHLEERITTPWTGDWDDRPAGPPVREGWCRFRPNATFDDPFLDAARSLLIIDTMGWPAVMMGRNEWPPFVAPTIELSVRFHRLIPASEWLLHVTTSPIAADGLIGSTSRVWSQDGALLASGGQHMLCRPAPA
jgi:acyl-CoA thioesterase